MSPERGVEASEVAACVVLYRPTPEVVANAATYLPSVDRLYVLENSGTEPTAPCRELMADPRVELVYAEDNPGIARALNAAAAKARAAGYRWLLTMDQDSRFAPGVLDRVWGEARNWAPLDDVAMIGTYLVFQGWEEAGPPSGPITLRPIPELITSGTLLNLPIYEALGGSDERLFIDCVDTDYCIRAKIAGHRILGTSRTVLDHSLGTPVGYGVGKHRKASHVHNHIRSYYITRNNLHLYYSYHELGGTDLRTIARRALKNVILGERPLLALGYNLRGVVDFMRGRWGKL